MTVLAAALERESDDIPGHALYPIGTRFKTTPARWRHLGPVYNPPQHGRFDPLRRWQVLTVVTVAMAVTRKAGNRWLSVKEAEASGCPDEATAAQVYRLIVEAPKEAVELIQKRDMREARHALTSLADRDDLTASDLALREVLTRVAMDGGVCADDIAKVAQVAAYWHNGSRRRYPRKEQWASLRNSRHLGTPGQMLCVPSGMSAEVTHVIPLEPLRMGGKRKPVTLRRRVLYKARTSEGDLIQWVEVERNAHSVRDLVKGNRILIRSGVVKDHARFRGVNITEFRANSMMFDVLN